MTSPDPQPRRGSLPETPESFARSRIAAVLMGLTTVAAIVAAFWVTIAEPGFVRGFHNWQSRTLGGGYYPQLTWVLAMAVIALPPVGIIATVDDAVQKHLRRR